MKKLGVVIPYYRTSTIREVLFKELVNLLKLQLKNRNDIEVVIVEDGSDSKWLQDDYLILRNHHINYIKLIENSGISFARNRSIEYLLDENCDYFVFIDSDDYIDYDYFDKIMNEIEVNPRTYYFTDFDILGNICPREGLRERVTGIVLHRSIIENARFDENIRLAEDVDFGNRFLRDKLTEPYYIDTVYHYNFGIDKKCLSYVGGDYNAIKE